MSEYEGTLTARLFDAGLPASFDFWKEWLDYSNRCLYDKLTAEGF